MEWIGCGQTDNLVGLRTELVDSLRRRDRDSQYEMRGTNAPKPAQRRLDRATRGNTVVDDDRRPVRHIDRWPPSKIALSAALNLAQLVACLSFDVGCWYF